MSEKVKAPMMPFFAIYIMILLIGFTIDNYDIFIVGTWTRILTLVGIPVAGFLLITLYKIGVLDEEEEEK